MKVRTKGIATTLGVLAAGWVVFALSGVAGATSFALPPAACGLVRYLMP